MKPVVAIVGRTNVGKSTLFNRLVRRRVAIIEDEPGVTRDRLYADIELDGRVVTLVDTGGIVDSPAEDIREPVTQQAIMAMSEADVVLFMVDGRQGLVPVDYEVAEHVRRAGRPTIVVVNKMESPKLDPHEFAALGFEHVIPISAKNNVNVKQLVATVVELLPEEKAEPEIAEHDIAVAIVGRPNVGKSSLLNRLLGEERAIVSEVPGTTRDAIDSLVEYEGKRILLIDTAGIRRKSRVKSSVEYYSIVRGLRAIDRSHLVLLLLDATEGATDQDARIAGYAHEKGKLVIRVVNKWDLLVEPREPTRELPYKLDDGLTPAKRRRQEKLLRQDVLRQIHEQLVFIDYAPTLFISARTGFGVDEIFPQLIKSMEQYSVRVPTSKLNRLMLDAAIEHPPPMRRGKRLKIYYATQAEICPPTVVLFVNDPELMHFSYERFLRNKIRKEFGVEGTPIRFVLRKRERKTIYAPSGGM